MIKNNNNQSDRPQGLSRKTFLKNTAWTLIGSVMTPTLLKAEKGRAMPADNRSGMEKEIGSANRTLLKNVRLETGFEYDQLEVVSTKTALFCIALEGGKIVAVLPNNPGADAIDAQGLLMLPSFKDMHIHLDKTFYGDKWQAIRRGPGGIKGMIALEQKILPDMLKNSTYKAEKLIELLQSKGSGYARSHVNIEPTSQLNSLKHLQIALENKKSTFGAELVAFPQHGVYYTASAPYMREAAQSGIDYIGGVDPFSIDGAIEKTMDFTIGLALEFNKGIDIHLHESSQSGLKTVEYLINKVHENQVLKGRTFLSHCFCLGRLDSERQAEMAAKLSDAGIGIVSTIPFGGLVMPIPTLLKHNVKVMTGNDSIVDHWNTFGSGSVLQKAHLAAQLYGRKTEFDLSRMLALATAGIMPLDDKGRQVWPVPGDAADFVLIDASCSAEAVARISTVKSLYHNGNPVF